MVQARLVNPISKVTKNNKVVAPFIPRFSIIQGCEGEEVFMTISPGDATPQDSSTAKKGPLTSGATTNPITRPAVEKVESDGMNRYYYDWD